MLSGWPHTLPTTSQTQPILFLSLLPSSPISGCQGKAWSCLFSPLANPDTPQNLINSSQQLRGWSLGLKDPGRSQKEHDLPLSAQGGGRKPDSLPPVARVLVNRVRLPGGDDLGRACLQTRMTGLRSMRTSLEASVGAKFRGIGPRRFLPAGLRDELS